MQADVPGPAGRVRSGDRVRRDRRVGRGVGHLQRERAIDEQHVGQRLARRAQRVADQRRAEARAIDVQVGRQRAAVARDDGGDVAVFAQAHPIHRRDDALDAQRLRMRGQQRGELAGVEVVRVVHRPEPVAVGRPLGCARRVGHALLHRHRIGERARRAVGRRGLAEQPVGQQLGRARALAGGVERMEVVVAGTRRGAAGRVGPVHELHALLERGVALAHEARLVEADRAERAADRRERAFADADDADLAGLDERDAHAAGGRAQRPGQEGRGEPAGGAAADDEDVLDGIHAVLSPAQRCGCILSFIGAIRRLGVLTTMSSFSRRRFRRFL